MLLFSDSLQSHRYCGHGNKLRCTWAQVKEAMDRLRLFSPFRFLINKIILIWACVEPFNCLVWFIQKCNSPFLPLPPSFVLSFHASLIVRFDKMWKIYYNIIQKLHKKYLWKKLHDYGFRAQGEIISLTMAHSVLMFNFSFVTTVTFLQQFI